MKFMSVPKTTNVDNKTIETNGDGQIQIKGGAICEEQFCEDLQKKVYFWREYSTEGEDFLFSRDVEQIANETKFFSDDIEIVEDICAKIGVIAYGNAEDSWLKLFVNDVEKKHWEIYSNYHDISKNCILDLKKGDIIRFQGYAIRGYFKLKKRGICGSLKTCGGFWKDD